MLRTLAIVFSAAALTSVRLAPLAAFAPATLAYLGGVGIELRVGQDVDEASILQPRRPRCFGLHRQPPLLHLALGERLDRAAALEAVGREPCVPNGIVRHEHAPIHRKVARAGL